MPAKEWQQFELAVAKFLRAIDPSAKVTHDKLTPDRHTGAPRQRDVWIEGKIGGFQLSILISCKALNRKLSQQDIDAFHGELASSGAHKGVIYSTSGFGKKAIEKARVLGISCCRLYQNQPPDIPLNLAFSSHCLRPKHSFCVEAPVPSGFERATVGQFLAARVGCDRDRTVYDAIVEELASAESRVVPKLDPSTQGILPLQCTWERFNCVVNGDRCWVRLMIDWEFFRGRVEAQLWNGTYDFSNEQFVGQQAFPSIDTQSMHPGKGWERVDATQVPLLAGPRRGVLAVMWGGKPSPLDCIRSKDSPLSICRPAQLLADSVGE